MIAGKSNGAQAPHNAAKRLITHNSPQAIINAMFPLDILPGRLYHILAEE